VTGGDKGGSHKLWGGRFASGQAPELEAVNRSITTDFRLWPFDIRLSKAWASALAGAGVLSDSDRDSILGGLDSVARRLEAGVELLASDEDVHTLIDRLLHAEAGEPAARLHTGRSRNDQVATATRLWTMDALSQVDGMVQELQGAMLVQSAQLLDAIMPAYTHLQRAQPVSGAHWMLSHFWPLDRDRGRLAAAGRGASALPLGSGAIAGTAFPVSREAIRDELGFARLTENSMDAVSDRDFIAEALFALGLLTAHLSRLAEDVILFGTSEFAFVRFGDAFSTGSSMMPQKRNPDALELARASGPRVLGDLVALLGTIKGLPTGYNKDLQEDKRALFDAVDCASLLLPAVTGTLHTLMFDVERMRSAVTTTMMATDLADYLVRKGVAFRDAHAAVGRLVRAAEDGGIDLAALPLSAFRKSHPAFGEDVLEEFRPAASVAHRNVPGGTGPTALLAQLEAARAVVGRAH
jgi:argininosuccinate lyase